MKKPELLLPAGGFERMCAAFDFGADAVYAGQPRYSLRARNNEFVRLESLNRAIDEAHRRGKKFFLASNLLAHNAKLKTYLNDLKPLVAMQPDALIMADPGLIMKVRECFHDMPIHLSVQANTTNSWGVRFWRDIGISRVILSRELSLDEIREIRDDCPDIELEVFVHGALCIAYSGRCLLSGYFDHRDANQGVCTNACRRAYAVRDAGEDAAGNLLPRQNEVRENRTFLLEDTQHPGAYLPAEEDEHGTYIMNSKDLRAVEAVEKLCAVGVDALKIEGRTKSLYYVARTAQSYRRAIDDAVAGRPFNPELLSDLEGLANRGYTSGFLERHRPAEMQNYLYGHSSSRRSRYVGQILSVDENGWAEVDVKNRFAVGDTLEIIHPTGNSLYTVAAMTRDDAPTAVAAGNGIVVKLPGMAGMNGALLAQMIADENA